MLEWHDEFLTGVRDLDNQHKEFHLKLNDFLKANVNAQGRGEAEGILLYLKNYVSEHFDTEERYMKLYSYPETDPHRKEHSDFIEILNRMLDTFHRDGITYSMVLELQNHMGEWYVHHIGISDRALGQFLKNKV